MIRFILGRLVKAVFILLAILIVNFLLIHAAPGDPAAVMAGEAGADATPQARLRRLVEVRGPCRRVVDADGRIGEAGHRGRADVLEPQHARTECVAHPRGQGVQINCDHGGALRYGSNLPHLRRGQWAIPSQQDLDLIHVKQL